MQPSPFPWFTASHIRDGGIAMEAQSLPLRLSLKDVEAQVRHVLHQICRGDAGAVARWYSMDSEARARQPRKAEIQYVIAREYGFKSWQSLKDHVAPFDV